MNMTNCVFNKLTIIITKIKGEATDKALKCEKKINLSTFPVDECA